MAIQIRAQRILKSGQDNAYLLQASVPLQV